MKNVILLLPIICLSLAVKAQTTGSFQQNITFNQADYNATRTLYFYVPTDYAPSQSYKLIVGFRGGPNSNAGQFRNQLTFLSDSLDAIILCPENAAHFGNGEGLTKQLFQYSVDTTMAMYNINPEFIYLTGLSYGGRHSVIVSMDTDNGLIPNLRGVIPFAAGSQSHLQPDYANIDDFPPACICIGLNDSSNFQAVSNNLHNDIQNNGGISILNEIPGVGHTVAFPTFPEEMMECINFIENQYETTGVAIVPALISPIVLYPNPAVDIIRWNYTKSIAPLEITINSISGQVLKSIKTTQTQAYLTGFSAGIYVLVIKTPDGIFTKRFSI